MKATLPDVVPLNANGDKVEPRMLNIAIIDVFGSQVPSLFFKSHPRRHVGDVGLKALLAAESHRNVLLCKRRITVADDNEAVTF